MQPKPSATSKMGTQGKGCHRHIADTGAAVMLLFSLIDYGVPGTAGSHCELSGAASLGAYTAGRIQISYAVNQNNYVASN